MKAILHFTVMILTLSFGACTDRTGPGGPAGLTGDSGLQGSQGETGENGSVNIQSTNWAPLVFDGTGEVYNTVNGLQAISTTNVILTTSSNDAPLISEAIFNSGVVLIYFKANKISYDSLTNSYIPKEQIDGGSINAESTGNFLIPDRAATKETDFQYYAITNTKVGVNYWSPTLYLTTRNYVDSNSVYQSYAPELLDKTLDYYRAFFSEMPQYRMIVIPSTTQARQKKIDYSDYSQIVEAFGLEY